MRKLSGERRNLLLIGFLLVKKVKGKSKGSKKEGKNVSSKNTKKAPYERGEILHSRSYGLSSKSLGAALKNG